MIIWLASYPRSGNTFFRVILNTVFQIKTYSIYNDTGDIAADDATSDIVGHTMLPSDFDIEKARRSKTAYYIKTHELMENFSISPKDKVIYLIRDGRESTLSFAKYLKNYYKHSDDLTDVIYGNTPFGAWGEHVMGWTQLQNYLLIRFETLTDDPTSQLKKIADYLGISAKEAKIPTFEELQQINPTFFRSGKKDSWKNVFTPQEHLAFWLRNYEPMIRFGYDTDMPKEVSEPSFQTYRTLFSKEIEALKNNLFIAEKCKQQKDELDKSLAVNRKLTEQLLDIAKLGPFKKYKAFHQLVDELKE